MTQEKCERVGKYVEGKTFCMKQFRGSYENLFFQICHVFNSSSETVLQFEEHLLERNFRYVFYVKVIFFLIPVTSRLLYFCTSF